MAEIDLDATPKVEITNIQPLADSEQKNFASTAFATINTAELILTA